MSLLPPESRAWQRAKKKLDASTAKRQDMISNPNMAVDCLGNARRLRKNKSSADPSHPHVENKEVHMELPPAPSRASLEEAKVAATQSTPTTSRKRARSPELDDPVAEDVMKHAKLSMESVRQVTYLPTS